MKIVSIPEESFNLKLRLINKLLERTKKKMAKEIDDLEETEEDDTEVDDDDTDNEHEEEDKPRKRGRPKGSTNSGKKANFHAIILTKRGAPKRVVVTHVMGKNVKVVSASNPDMDALRIDITRVRYFDSDVFDQLSERAEKIDNAINQNFGLFNQLKPLNAPKRIAQKSSDPADDL